MDDLKQYRKAWKNQELESHQVNKNTIIKMIHQRSSSIVKWIFYISLIEFIVLTLINIFVKIDNNETELEEIGLQGFINGVSIFVGYIVPLLFIYLFYRNYKRISVTSTTKELILNILKTRRTVKYYIITILSIITLTLLYSTFVILQSAEYSELLSNYGSNNQIIIWIVVILFIVIADGLILLFYLLLYGFLVRHLNRNYKELIKK